MAHSEGGHRVPVVIPTRNRASLLSREVSSVLPQCHDGDEVIVVDDQSDDSTEERVQSFGDRSLCLC
jgi:glycosyltransferase involved in cell wall biosynthesis